MDKYQNSLMKHISFAVDGGASVAYSDGVLTLTQNEDPEKGSVTLSVRVICILEAVFSGEVYTPSNNVIKIPIVFSKTASKSMTFKIADGITDDIEFEIKYIEADREAWAAKKKAERIKELLLNADVTSATNTNLVNIYFSECCSEHKKTEINLYRDERFIGKYAVDEGKMFLSVTGLALGEYHYEVIMLDRDGNELVRTEMRMFVIKN